MPQQPDVVAAIRTDLADCRQWVARVVVLVYAAAAGLAAVALTLLSEHALQGFSRLRAWQPPLPLIWTPAWIAALAWIMLRFAPGASGLGIPQVDGGAVSERRRGAPSTVRLAEGLVPPRRC